MTAPNVSFNFTKLLVGDLDKTAAFYEAVFGLNRLAVVEDAIVGRQIREVMYKPTQEGGATFVILSFLDAPAPIEGETITGFTVTDLNDVLAKVQANGGSIAEPIRDMPQMGIRVAFARDNEGHLIEIVQMAG